jgi:hypothetical protein
MSKKRLCLNAIAVTISLMLCGTPPVYAQETPPMNTYTFTVEWSTENAEEDVQYYQVIMSDIADPTQMAPYGEKIPFNANNPDRPATISQQVTVSVPADADTDVWVTAVAIDTSGNNSFYAKPWVGYKFPNQPPAIPQGLKGGAATEVTGSP